MATHWNMAMGPEVRMEVASGCGGSTAARVCVAAAVAWTMVYTRELFRPCC